MASAAGNRTAIAERVSGVGFSIKLAPGVRVRASSRGLRTSVGPRAARVHFGAGRTGVSTGAGPVGFYSSLGGGRSRSGSRGGRSRGSSTASYQRELAQQQRQAEQAQRSEDAKELIKTFEHILSLHREEFPPATRPIALPQAEPDRSDIYAFYKRQALQGVGLFKRAEREQAKQKATAWTEAEVHRLRNEHGQQHQQAQAYLDQMWRQLCSNVPEVVLETLQEAFEDNEAPSAPLSVNGDEVSLAVLVPGIDEVVPERWPTVTQAGNLTFRKLPKRERSDYYTIFVCAQVLVTVREAFAVAPGIQSARVTALRVEGRTVYGEPYVACLMAAAFDRAALAAVLWESASASDVVNQASKECLLKQKRASKDLTPLDLSGEPELRALVRSIDLRDLGQESAGVHAGPAKPSRA